MSRLPFGGGTPSIREPVAPIAQQLVRCPAMWRVEYDPDDGLLSLRLLGHVGPSTMRELAQAHAEALEATGGEPFRVLLDLRGMTPLEDDAVDLLGELKRVAASVEGFRAMAILVDSATVAMQQQRTRVGAEVVTLDEAEAMRVLSG